MSVAGHGYRTLKSIFHERGEAAVQENCRYAATATPPTSSTISW